MQDQPNSWHLGPLECSLQASRLPHEPGDMIRSRWQSRVVGNGQVNPLRFASVPASNEGVSRSGVGKVSGETMTSLHTHTQVGMKAEVNYLIS